METMAGVKIIDAVDSTNIPLPGVTVTYVVEEEEHSGSTGNDGVLHLGQVKHNTQVSIVAEKENYDILKESVVADGCGTPKTLSLNPQVCTLRQILLLIFYPIYLFVII